MSTRIINIDDEYCPNCGGELILCQNTTLHSEYYYCPNCDSIFVLKAVELTQEEVDTFYFDGRHERMKDHAKFLRAKKSVTKEDLIKLGKLKG